MPLRSPLPRRLLPSFLRHRTPDWRFAGATAAILATFLVVIAAAVQAHVSWRERHRESIASLEQIMDYSARLYAAEIMRAAAERRSRLLAPVLGAPLARDEPAMSLATFRNRVAGVVTLEGMPTSEVAGYFRILLDADTVVTGGFEGEGVAADSLIRAAILAGIARRLLDVDRSDEPGLTIVPGAGTSSSAAANSAAFARQRRYDGTPVAVLGVLYSRRHSIQTVAKPILRELPLVPPWFAGEAWTRIQAEAKRRGEMPAYPIDRLRGDTLLSVRVVDLNGELLYASPTQFESEVQGSVEIRSPAGGFGVALTLQPAAAAWLAREVSPPSQRLLLIALVGLGALGTTGALLLVRRERQLVRARHEFVSAVSHELRTPLTQIRMFGETLLLGRAASDEQRQRWLGIITREARHLGDIVENILLVAAADGQRRPVRLSPVWVEASEVVSAAAANFGPMAAQRDTTVVRDVEAGLYALVDPGALRQIVVNLLDNALKYGPPGQRITVTLARALGRPHELQLAVTDQGPGIPPRHRERVWRPFERLSSRGGATGGSGIGLSVVRDLARLHGGRAWIEDAASGPGARFVVALPVGTPPAAAPAAPLAPAGAGVAGVTPRAFGREGV